MKNVIYSKVIVPMCDSVDGETATYVEVTEEINIYCVWAYSYDCGRCLIFWYERWDRESAIEKGVDMSRFLLGFAKEGSDVVDEKINEIAIL